MSPPISSVSLLRDSFNKKTLCDSPNVGNANLRTVTPTEFYLHF